MSVHIGTSGWSYPSGEGTWNGLFYPATRSKRNGTGAFDELRFYAEYFDTVEVNTSFYGLPRAEVTAGWVARTPPRFLFSLKLYQKFTHPRMFRDAALRSAPGSEGTLLDALTQVTQGDIDDFRAGIEPIAREGKLGALLAQFPPSFKDSPAARDYLERLLRSLTDYPMAVELRHRSWSDAFGDTLQLLNAFQTAWAQIDEPKFRFSIRQNALPNVTGFYYLRLHGRNAAQWWHHEKAEDRYNYLYAAGELKEFAESAAAARQLVKKVYVYMNNHFAAKSVVNAAMLKAQLGEPVEGCYPPALMRRYAELRTAASASARVMASPSPS